MDDVAQITQPRPTCRPIIDWTSSVLASPGSVGGACVGQIAVQGLQSPGSVDSKPRDLNSISRLGWPFQRESGIDLNESFSSTRGPSSVFPAVRCPHNAATSAS